MNVLFSRDFHQHEQVVFCADAASGLKAIIAIHNTNLGPALGGCRIYPYDSEEQAVRDVLRLSEGMTYKAALAHLPLGGGKAVIIADAKKDKTPQLLRAFASYVERLGGLYITAEDVGSSVDDMDIMRTVSSHVVGSAAGSGDPSPFTAAGVVVGLEATLSYLKKPNVSGLRVAIQGVGHVGMHLCKLLAERGAQLTITDVDQAAITKACNAYGATYVAPNAIYDVDVDVFMPSALGGILNDDTIPRLKAFAVVGSANNQLEATRHGAVLRDQGIFYAPDYVVNAGGLINVFYESRHYNVSLVMEHIDRIHDTLFEIYTIADKERISNNLAADRLAEARFAKKTTDVNLLKRA